VRLSRTEQAQLETSAILPHDQRFEQFQLAVIQRLKLKLKLLGGLDTEQIGSN
jgi:hypothetical protein